MTFERTQVQKDRQLTTECNMPKVICISDSEESCQSTKDKANNGRDSDEDTEFDFPAVQFYYEEDVLEEDYSEVDKPEEGCSEVDKPEEDDDSQVDEPEEDEYEHVARQHTTTKAKQKQNVKNVDAATIEKKQKAIKPDEWLNLITVYIDDGLETNDFLFHITNTFNLNNIDWKVQKLPINNSIMWKTKDKYGKQTTETHILIIWNWDKATKTVKDDTFEYHLTKLLHLVPNMKPTLVLCGMDEYFQAKKAGKRTTRIPKNKGLISFYDAPKITKPDLEMYLIQIQQNLKCSSRMIEFPEELGPFVFRYTKSIAQIPFKKLKRQKVEEKLDWYAHGDNRDTVRVDNCGNGLLRLWQQQLCQFTLGSLETAEAIMSYYPSPLQLITAYKKCTKREGEILLKDIPVRRAAGHLSTVRKIGPELSKKICILFTSKDGKATLGN